MFLAALLVAALCFSGCSKSDGGGDENDPETTKPSAEEAAAAAYAKLSPKQKVAHHVDAYKKAAEKKNFSQAVSEYQESYEVWTKHENSLSAEDAAEIEKLIGGLRASHDRNRETMAKSLTESLESDNPKLQDLTNFIVYMVGPSDESKLAANVKAAFKAYATKHADQIVMVRINNRKGRIYDCIKRVMRERFNASKGSSKVLVFMENELEIKDFHPWKYVFCQLAASVDPHNRQCKLVIKASDTYYRPKTVKVPKTSWDAVTIQIPVKCTFERTKILVDEDKLLQEMESRKGEIPAFL